MVELRVLSGEELAAALDGLAHLRITVFREWPYLYDGNAAYERRYLKGYADDPEAILIAAFDGNALVGASTGIPLEAHGDARSLVLPDGLPDRGAIYYCAESILLPDYRGQGFGNAFFDIREDTARKAGFKLSLFASVIRDADDPRRPANYRSLDPFWRKRGYAPLPGAFLTISWQDIGAARETEKRLQVWSRPL